MLVETVVGYWGKRGATLQDPNGGRADDTLYSTNEGREVFNGSLTVIPPSW